MAAVEFALILPILTIMLIGAIEMGDAVTVDRRVSMVASTAGDLLARYDGNNVTEAQVADIGQVAGWLMDPYSSTGTKVTLSYIFLPAFPGPGAPPVGGPAVNDPNIRKVWSCVYLGANANSVTCTCPATPSAGASYTMPQTGLINYNEGVVVSDVEYQYTPLFFDNFMSKIATKVNGAFTLKEKLHMKPRGAGTALQQANGFLCKLV